MTDTASQMAVTAELPPGVHPMDPSGTPEPSPVGTDIGQAWTPGEKPFGVPNARAVPVWERATTNFAVKALNVTTTLPAAGRLVGRRSVSLWVPGTASQGVQFSSDRGSVDSGAGVPLNPGDSITIGSEAAVYVGPIDGQTSGTVYVLDLYNALAD